MTLSSTARRRCPSSRFAVIRFLGTLGTGGVRRRLQGEAGENLNACRARRPCLMPDKDAARAARPFQAGSGVVGRGFTTPNIVTVYDGGECEQPKGQVYPAMNCSRAKTSPSGLKPRRPARRANGVA